MLEAVGGSVSDLFLLFWVSLSEKSFCLLNVFDLFWFNYREKFPVPGGYYMVPARAHPSRLLDFWTA